MKIVQAITELTALLTAVYPADEAKTIAHYYFECRTGLTPFQLYSSRDSETDWAACENDVQRLLRSEPVQYVTGIAWFYGLQFKVRSGVLIPRPETEELVKTAIGMQHAKQTSVLDIGTGSGCIAIAIKKHLPDVIVYATDLSEIALETARENAEASGIEIHFIKDDIFSPVLKCDLGMIICNPPYVTESEKGSMRKNVLNYEPHSALFVSDNDPLRYYGAVAGFASEMLTHGGSLLFEINEAYQTEVCDLLKQKHFFNIEAKKDINGKWRIVSAQKP